MRSRRVLLPELVQRERGLRRTAAFVEPRRIAPFDGLRLVLDGEDAVADSESLQRQVHDSPRAFIRHDFEMIGLAADHDAESDEGAEAAASRGERDRAGNLERAGDGQRLMLVA